MRKYLMLTEAVLDLMLMHEVWSAEKLPVDSERYGIASEPLSDEVVAYYSAQEGGSSYFALIDLVSLSNLLAVGGGDVFDVYRRIVRVVKGLRSPPIHLPRQWSEYHYRNLLTFFALPKGIANLRWVAESDGINRCVRFDAITSSADQVDLAKYLPTSWPNDFEELMTKARSLRAPKPSTVNQAEGLVTEIDLSVIGSSSVAKNRTYEDWLRDLSDSQKNILALDTQSSVRIVGPAGSGKTLALCLRVLQISRSSDVISQGRKILVATHSWAMAERIDGILCALNGGVIPSGAVVFPLLSLLQLHAGHIGQQAVEVIGDDSTEGRVKVIEIIKQILDADGFRRDGLSDWILAGLKSPDDGRPKLDLLFNLYEEISGVLTASSVAPDDPEAVRAYLTGVREDWMPPFVSMADRSFVLHVYKSLLRILVDRSAITTDQFVLDSIRVLETYTWRMRRETDGYDYIFVDELQLFDAQERSALELLGRSRKGVPFVTAEDPSQGVFSSLHSRRGVVSNQAVYLETIHRFDKEIFDLISFFYQKFPLNTLPLKIGPNRPSGSEVPKLYLAADSDSGVELIVSLVQQALRSASGSDRVCIATMGDTDARICDLLESNKIPSTRLASFDDVEQLGYRKKSVIVAPWQFIGGTQFSHVILSTLDISPAVTSFGKRHELTGVYLSCSRATRSLSIVSGDYVPLVVRDAKEHGLIALQG